jgi:hypothetical protein
MLKDPTTAWDGPFPYDVLAVVGVTPQLPHAGVLDVSFELLAQGLMTPETRKAWEELRLPQRRLLVDFFLYDVELAPEIAAAQAAVDDELRRPGAPPEAAAALELPPSLLDDLAGELREVALEPPPPLEPMPEFDDLASSRVLDELIRFDG